MFHPDYKYITDKLPTSLVKRAYHRLLTHSRNPIPLERISKKCDRVEDYLRHTLNIYENSLGRRRKIMDRKRPQSWPECPTSLSEKFVYVADRGTQAVSTTFDHEKEINRQVMKELDIIYKHLLDYNRDTFGRFMQNLTLKHEERAASNRQLRSEIEDMKLQVQEAEEILASMKAP